MDLFEFILIITSVIYALALGQLLAGTVRLIQTKKSVHWYLPQSLWVVILFMGILMTWWTSWVFRDIEWTFFKYLYMVVNPVLVFIACALVGPGDLVDDHVDLEEHFLRVRRVFLPCFFLASVSTFIDNTVIMGEPIWSGSRVTQIALLIAVLAGLFTERRRLQTVFSSTVLVILVGNVALNFSQPV